jgi:multicomponent Na+:H+ antiporter subunit G
MEFIIPITLLIGIFFMVVASLGIVTLPDLYTRMHAATKAGTVGIGFVLLTAALAMQDITVTSRVIGALFFILLTAPIAAHMLGKAMLKRGYKMWRANKNTTSIKK